MEAQLVTPTQKIKTEKMLATVSGTLPSKHQQIIAIEKIEL
jgi:hypothetical protein